MIIDLARHKKRGDNIYFHDYQGRKLVGWTRPKPKIGDRVKLEMKFDYPGRYFKLFTIVSLKEESNPPDMFWADVEDSGIIIEKKNSTLVFEVKSRCPVCNKKINKNFDKMLSHIEKKHKDSIIN